MDGQELIKAYHTFYQTANPDNDFVTALKQYDFSDYYAVMEELAKLRPYKCGKVMKLLTNGTTTGIAKTYTFGPISALPQIELALQTTEPSYIIWLNAYNERNISDLTDNKHLFHNITFNLKLQFDNTNLHILLQHMKSIHGKISLVSKPLSLLYLSNCPAFLNILDTFQEQISIISTSDWEPLFRKLPLTQRGIHVNDNMIDWGTGINFYHCSHQQLHFLPTFIYDNQKVRNLLNLTTYKRYHSDDIINLGTVVPCSCGKNRMEFSFTPHQALQISNYLTLKPLIYDTLEQLIDPYINLQFIETSDTMNILYTLSTTRSMSDHDQHLLTKTLPLPVVFQKDKLVLRGAGKIVPFIKSTNPILDYKYSPKHIKLI